MRPEANSVLVPEIAAKESNMSITAAWMEEIRESLNSHDVDRIVANFDENGEFLWRLDRHRMRSVSWVGR